MIYKVFVAVLRQSFNLALMDTYQFIKVLYFIPFLAQLTDVRHSFLNTKSVLLSRRCCRYVELFRLCHNGLSSRQGRG